MDSVDSDDLEIKLLLNAINDRYGYDFTQYAKASLKRRLKYIISDYQLAYISELIPKLLHDQVLFKKFITQISVPVTEMFRDPEFFINFKEKVIPVLRTYPFIKMWIAGCASGEEAYSFAILFKEAGLLERTHIYATDLNEKALKTATKAIYPSSNIKEYTANYNRFSNECSLSEYYHAKYDSVIMNDDLRQHISFASHNLVCDGNFGEMNIISCRNVMIYFDNHLQNKVLDKFVESLVTRGFLCLGNKESLVNTSVKNKFEVISSANRIYQLNSGLSKRV